MERPVTARLEERINRAVDRRRYRRVEVAWDITVESIRRFEWSGEIVSFGPFGMKVRLKANEPVPTEGTVVRLQFVPPDEKSPLSIEGIVCRVDPDGLAITLMNLKLGHISSAQEARRRSPGESS